MDLHRRGFVPILLDGRSLDDTDVHQVHALIDQSFAAAYKGPSVETYRQLESSKRAFIVDDFHRSPLNIKSKDEVAAVLAGFAEVVVLMVDETFELAALRGNYGKPSTLWEFLHCNIMPLGYHLRYDLVRRWCALGRGNTDDPDVTSRETEKKDRAVTYLIGQNFLPAYPAFVLLCLQQLELKTPDRNNLGSFGHLYEALLARSILAGGIGSGMDLDAKQQFLADLSYRMFRTDQETLDAREFEHAYEDYCNTFHVSFPRGRVEKELAASTILQNRSGRYGFRYKYAYLFFLARHLRDHLEEVETQNVVRQLCTRLHHEPSANTLLFLCHLSKHSFVLDSIISAARSLFPDAPALELENALTPLAAAPVSRALELPSQDHHANRRFEREKRDHFEAQRIPVRDSEYEGLPKAVDGHFRRLQDRADPRAGLARISRIDSG